MPYALWLVSGLVPWFFFSDALVGGTNALIEYNYLVKKVVFNINILPVVKVLSAGVVHVFFVVFTVLTHYTLVYAGTGGLNLLSFVSGLSDITPFILNLLQNTGSVAVLVVVACSMQAIISNILVNMFYALFFAGKGSKLRPWILGGFGTVIGVNLVLLLFFYL